MSETVLDAAHRLMAEAPEEEMARLGYYARLVEGELSLLLAAEAEGERVVPRVFELEEGPVVLAFDREDRLAEFAGGPAPYATLPGRALIRMLAGRGLGLGVNLQVAPSQMLLPSEVVDWLAGVLEEGPQEASGRPLEAFPPKGLAPEVLAALERALAKAAGLAAGAWLAGAEFEGGRRGYLLAVEAAAPGAEEALARAVAEAVTFAGVEGAGVDVVFLAAGDPVLEALSRVGLRFDLTVDAPEPRAPGSDPGKPPILR